MLFINRNDRLYSSAVTFSHSKTWFNFGQYFAENRFRFL